MLRLRVLLLENLRKNTAIVAKATDLKFASPKGQPGSEFQVQSCFRGIVSKASLDLECDDKVDPDTGRI
jgi:hypothetical protein